MYISIDLGGTSTRVASSLNFKETHKVQKFPTNKDLSEQKQLIESAIKVVSAGTDIKGISLGVPGLLNRRDKKFLKVPNYAVLNDLPFTELLPQNLKNVCLCVANDAALAGFGEAVYGAGIEFDRVVYITLSTGVGGLLVDHKNVDCLFHDFEPGHHIIVENGKLNKGCGQHGCMEAYASGSAFATNYNVSPTDCYDEKIWDDYASHLAIGIINVIAFWDPDVIVFGGNVSNYKFEYFKPALIEHLKKQNFFNIPKLKAAAFGDDAGIYGGFAFLEKTISEALI